MKISIVALLLAASFTVAAQEQDTAWFIYGPGVRTCGAWSNDETFRNNAWLWVEGYLTGASATLAIREHIPMAKTEPEGIKGWVTQYCAGHPLDTIASASLALMVELNKRAQ